MKYSPTNRNAPFMCLKLINIPTLIAKQLNARVLQPNGMFCTKGMQDPQQVVRAWHRRMGLDGPRARPKNLFSCWGIATVTALVCLGRAAMCTRLHHPVHTGASWCTQPTSTACMVPSPPAHQCNHGTQSRSCMVPSTLPTSATMAHSHVHAWCQAPCPPVQPWHTVTCMHGAKHPAHQCNHGTQSSATMAVMVNTGACKATTIQTHGTILCTQVQSWCTQVHAMPQPRAHRCSLGTIPITEGHWPCAPKGHSAKGNKGTH